MLFARLQAVFSYKWYYPARIGYTEKLEEFKRISRESQIRVIILGVSRAENAIDPMRIYKARGIQSFNFSSNGQYPAMSYAFCAEAFRHSSPQVVLLDISSFFRSDDSFLNQYKFVLDTLPLRKNKVELAKKYVEYYPKNQQIGALCEALLPMYAYHGRWSQLSASDFISVTRIIM